MIKGLEGHQRLQDLVLNFGETLLKEDKSLEQCADLLQTLPGIKAFSLFLFEM